MSTLTTIAFIGEIKEHGENVFVKCSYTNGAKENREIQYVEYLVSKDLKPLFQAALVSQQVINEKTVNTLTSQICEITVLNPMFRVNDTFLNGSGLLTSIRFGNFAF
jgi:methylaspartate ammonia-lyase